MLTAISWRTAATDTPVISSAVVPPDGGFTVSLLMGSLELPEQ